ncbi:MAG: NmrA family transcriptional regulator [Acidimicrobiales bacterium]
MTNPNVTNPNAASPVRRSSPADSSAGLVAVTTATGKIGRRVLRNLESLGPAGRAGSRRGPLRFDWHDPATWPGFVAGASAVFVAYVPDIGFPGAASTLAAFGRICRRENVSTVVLLSGRGEPGAERSEQALAAEVGPITVVRGSWFQQNFSESFLRDPVLDGVIALPAGEITEGFVDAEDVAAVVTAGLLDPARHRGRCYELTGPDLLSFAAVAEILAEATRRPVRYVPVSPADYVGQAVAAGMDPTEARAYAELFSVITDGRNERLTGDVAAVLGREPSSLAGYATAAVASGVWDR